MVAAEPPPLPSSCPILVGRSASLVQLLQVAERAAAGQGQVALVSGDAGIGKSRLLEEAKARLLAGAGHGPAPGLLVLEGRCFEEDRHYPYAPLVDLLRRYFAGGPRRPAGSAAELPPELAQLLPGLDHRVITATAHAAMEPEQEQRRLQNALVRFLMERALRRPLFMIVEDAHWADDASLDFLHFLARHLDALPVLLALTYRDAEVGPGLARLLAMLERRRLAVAMPLSPLPPTEVEAMIRAIFGLRQTVDADFLRAIYAFTEGNPLFVEETLRSLVATGDTFYADGHWDRKPLEELHIPRAVRVAVQQRLPALGGPARQLLTMAAIAGRRFDVAVLRDASGQDEATLIAAIKELVAAQLVVEETADEFSFRHALIQQAVAASLLLRERRALHAVLAQAMERFDAKAGQSYAADLAYHFEQTGDWAKVLTYAPQAGEQAFRMYALSSAIAQLSRALDAARHLGVPPPLAILRRRGQAHEMAGHFAEALADSEATLQLARRAGDDVAEWQSLMDLAQLWVMRDLARRGQCLRQALDLARRLEDPALVTSSLSFLGEWYVNDDQPSEARGCHQEALALAEVLGDRHTTAMVLHYLGHTDLKLGQQREGTSHMARAAALFRETGNRQGYVASLVYSIDRGPTYLNPASPWIQGDLAELARDVEEALLTAREIGWRAGEAFGHIQLALSLGPHGEYARALAAAQRGQAIADDMGHGPLRIAALCALSSLHLDMLAPERARALIERGRPLLLQLGLVFAARHVGAVAATACIMAGDLPAAQRELDAVSGPDLPVTTLAQRHVWCARAELALARRQPAECLRIADLLIGSIDREDGEATAPPVAPRLWILRGQALAALGRLDEAAADLRAAAATAQAHGARPLLWRAQSALARVCRRLGASAEAEHAATAARTLVAALAKAIDDYALRSEFLQSALAQLPRQTTPTPRRAAKLQFDGLTEREREVAALLREGLSNRAAAEELVLSERTVERHVANIMAKLGLSSRSQVALWAAERGLASSRR